MLKHFLEKLKSIKGDYMNSSPKEKWKFVLNMAMFAFKAIGIGVLDPKFEVWWYTYTSGVAFLDYIISFIYTIWFYDDQPVKRFLAIALVGIVIPPIMVFVMVLNPSKREALQSQVYFSGENIYPDFNEELSRKYFMICEKKARKLLMNTIQIIGVLLLSGAQVLIMPGFAYFLYNDIQLPVPVLFPFTDIASANGLIINMLNQLFMSTPAIVGHIGIEVVSCMFKNTFELCTEAICFAIDELSEKIVNPNAYSDACINKYFRNILMQTQDLDRYILAMLRFFCQRLLWQPILLCFGTTMALFFYLQGVWLSALGVAFVSFTQLYIQCDYGERTKSCNEKLLLKLHEMPWYAMSTKSQLAFGHLLNRLQNGAVFRMGPFDELNFETLSNMTKRIYTILMMLFGMIE